MAGWTARDIPPQAGRVALVTGATGGIGFEVARALAAAGAEVLLGARDAARAADAIARIGAETPDARLHHVPLDLADLRGVRDAAAAVAARCDRLDLLLNVAGVMALPRRHLTADAFEMQFGVNFLGHFALTAALLPLLRRGATSRVVGVTSLAYRLGHLDFDDLQAARGYRPWRAYAQSKLAVLSFALELQRRSARGGWGVASLAAHPGWAMTNLYANGAASEGTPRLLLRLMHAATRLFAHSAEVGARPILFAATAEQAVPGGHYGRCWFCEMRGPPAPARITAAARDEAGAARLWQAAETLTGARFPEV
ncbi:short chain dehydrogenase [Falsiroseomonas bella]|uniref:Short chain dehydrogenase n=1 Tax=Falsiroseomonas bella TaxID=2184016 RepID=A0A317FHQ4_9PROT|nr:SDR family oxidoreductase [Falsiroseomonas bella]PWS38614.1 short chain dehydrogenase [Falsiroseomonas bella]